MPSLVSRTARTDARLLAAIAVSESVWITAAFAALSGIGVAAFRPAGASRAREASGDDHVVMSWFSLGGTSASPSPRSSSRSPLG